MELQEVYLIKILKLFYEEKFLRINLMIFNQDILS